MGHNTPPDKPSREHNGGSLIPPRGFKAELYGLRHRFFYSFTLSAVTGTMNSAIITLVKSFKTTNAPTTIVVNRHDTDVVTETGAICGQMAIIDKLKLTLKFNKTAINQSVPLTFSYTPIFGQFEQKWDAADDDTGLTVAAILGLTKDATEEDLTPLTTNKLDTTGESDQAHPLSTVHLTEAFDTHLNMTTNATMEDTVYDDDIFHKHLAFGTNSGALKACVGRTRHISLKEGGHVTHHFNKFVPRSIRRIMPFTYFGILINVPLVSERNQYYSQAALTASKGHIGVKAIISYDEWHPDHDQKVTA